MQSCFAVFETCDYNVSVFQRCNNLENWLDMEVKSIEHPVHIVLDMPICKTYRNSCCNMILENFLLTLQFKNTCMLYYIFNIIVL
jgi:hypothetical protein